MRWNDLSIPKPQWLYHGSLGMNNWFHPAFYKGCNHLFMLGLKLNHIIKWAEIWLMYKLIDDFHEIEHVVTFSLDLLLNKEWDNVTVTYALTLSDTENVKYILWSTITWSTTFLYVRCIVRNLDIQCTMMYYIPTIYLLSWRYLLTREINFTIDHLTRPNNPNNLRHLNPVKLEIAQKGWHYQYVYNQKSLMGHINSSPPEQNGRHVGWRQFQVYFLEWKW